MRRIAITLSACLLAACSGGNDAGNSTENGPTSQAPTPSTSTQSTPPASPSSVDLSALPAPYNSANYDAGRRQFRRCGSCHTVTEDGSHRVGPNLFGLFGREAGSAENFNYSSALETAGFVWTPEQLDAWLANPREFLPGNRMSFVGLRNEEDRRDVIAYLLHETSPVED